MLFAGLLFLCVAAEAFDFDSELKALSAFYNTTGGSGWSNNNNWLNTSVSFDEWNGLSTDESFNGSVTAIDFGSNNMQGSLPDEIGLLTGLTSLTISNNANLNGPLPSSIVNCTNLEGLFFVKSDLSGTIPTNIGLLTKLSKFKFVKSKLSGPIPESFGNLGNLLLLETKGNPLTGTIPNSLGNLGNLTFMSLAENSLTGTIPSELSGMSSLILFFIKNNGMTGTLSSQLGSMTTLTRFKVEDNCLTGKRAHASASYLHKCAQCRI